MTTFTYNDSATPPNKIATTNGHWVQTNMDGFGRTIRTITGNGTTTVSTVDTQYVPTSGKRLQTQETFHWYVERESQSGHADAEPGRCLRV